MVEGSDTILVCGLKVYTGLNRNKNSPSLIVWIRGSLTTDREQRVLHMPLPPPIIQGVRGIGNVSVSR